MLDRSSFKLGMIMDLPSGHMHVDWIFGPIQDGRLAAIFDVNMGRIWGVSGRNSDMLDRSSFKLGMIMDLPSGHMHVDWIFGPIQDGRLAAIFDVNMGRIWGVSGRNSDMLDWSSFKLGMIMDLPSGHMHVDRI